MLEIAPGVYVAPNMTKGVRERVWDVMIEWHEFLPPDGGVLMTFFDNAAVGGQAMQVLGFPKKELIDVDGLWLARVPKEERGGDGPPPESAVPNDGVAGV